MNQLITDFGRTTNLAASANFAAKAENQNAMATKEQILLAVDQAFYSALQAHAVLTVAQQTVSARQTVSDQVDALFKSKLRSQLDFSFASVNLAQAKLLLLDAENNENAALAALSAVLGYPTRAKFSAGRGHDGDHFASGQCGRSHLPGSRHAPGNIGARFSVPICPEVPIRGTRLVFPNHPRRSELWEIRRCAIRFFPIGTVRWASTLEFPCSTAFSIRARSREARLRTQATQDRLLDLRNRISRDVRTSWLNANTAYQRVSVTQQLLDQASLALDLAQTRYSLGLSSIVELSQAQLQQTQAQISNAQAGYDYRLALAVLRYQTTGI